MTGPPAIDPTRPSAARLYDYYLGGKDNFTADRTTADALSARLPELPTLARANRAWLGRVVRHLAQAGITQFLDLGAGLPAPGGAVHQIAQKTSPEARVVYVDNDAMVLAHGRALLAKHPLVRVAAGDLRAPAALLADPATTGLLDLARPVAVLLAAVLHFLSDEDAPHRVVDVLRAGIAPGSYLALSHVASDTAPDRAAVLEQAYAATSSPLRPRSREQIAAFLTGLDLVAPGLVPVDEWRPDPDQPRLPPGRAWLLGGVGRVGQHRKPP